MDLSTVVQAFESKLAAARSVRDELHEAYDDIENQISEVDDYIDQVEEFLSQVNDIPNVYFDVNVDISFDSDS